MQNSFSLLPIDSAEHKTHCFYHLAPLISKYPPKSPLFHLATSSPQSLQSFFSNLSFLTCVSDLRTLFCSSSTGAIITLLSFSAEDNATKEELGGDKGRCGELFPVIGEGFLCFANRGTGIEIGVDISDTSILGLRRKVRAA
jgi:hypothetical protein